MHSVRAFVFEPAERSCHKCAAGRGYVEPIWSPIRRCENVVNQHVEQRLTAILAADFAGYGRLMGA
jgi:hypothetical protein